MKVGEDQADGLRRGKLRVIHPLHYYPNDWRQTKHGMCNRQSIIYVKSLKLQVKSDKNHVLRSWGKKGLDTYRLIAPYFFLRWHYGPCGYTQGTETTGTRYQRNMHTIAWFFQTGWCNLRVVRIDSCRLAVLSEVLKVLLMAFMIYVVISCYYNRLEILVPRAAGRRSCWFTDCKFISPGRVYNTYN